MVKKLTDRQSPTAATSSVYPKCTNHGYTLFVFGQTKTDSTGLTNIDLLLRGK